MRDNRPASRQRADLNRQRAYMHQLMRERPNEVHDRLRRDVAPVGRIVRAADLRPILPWISEASKDVADHLRAFAAKYPDRFEYRDGKLQTRRRP